jgi:hypothetical protein
MTIFFVYYDYSVVFINRYDIHFQNLRNQLLFFFRSFAFRFKQDLPNLRVLNDLRYLKVIPLFCDIYKIQFKI